MTHSVDRQAELRLLQSARLGDREAQAELLDRCQDTIYRFCRAQLGDSEAARDATQETALRMLAGLQRFRGASRWQTWALGVALNVCREQRRATTKRFKQAEQAEQAEGDVPAADCTPEQAADKREQAQRLHQFMDRLPQRQREALVLRYFEGFSIEETGEAMSVSAGTVKAATFQALRNLRRFWREDS